MQKQPNFELLKTKFYQFVISHPKFGMLPLLDIVRVPSLKNNWHKANEQNKVELNQFLDNLDIRNYRQLVDILIENKIDVPKWIVHNNLVIDYNDYEVLNLIKSQEL